MSTRPLPPEVPPTQRVSYLKKSAWRPSNPTLPSANVFVYNSSKTARKSLPSFLYVQLSYRMHYLYTLTAIAPRRTTAASTLSTRTTRYSFLVSVALARPRVIFLVYDSRSSKCLVWVCSRYGKKRRFAALSPSSPLRLTEIHRRSLVHKCCIFVVLWVSYALLFLCRYEMPNAILRFLNKEASTAEGPTCRLCGSMRGGLLSTRYQPRQHHALSRPR